MTTHDETREASLGDGVSAIEGAPFATKQRRKKRRKKRRRIRWAWRELLVAVVVMGALGGLFLVRRQMTRYPQLDVFDPAGRAAPAVTDRVLPHVYAMTRDDIFVGTATYVGSTGEHSHFLTSLRAAAGGTEGVAMNVIDSTSTRSMPARVVASDAALGVALLQAKRWRDATSPLVATRAPVGSVVFVASRSTIASGNVPVVTASRVRGPTAVLEDTRSAAEGHPWIALEAGATGQEDGAAVFSTSGAVVGITVEQGLYAPTDAIARFAQRSGLFTVPSEAPNQQAWPAPEPLIPTTLPPLPIVDGRPAIAIARSETAAVLLSPGPGDRRTNVLIDGATVRVARLRGVPPFGVLVLVTKPLQVTPTPSSTHLLPGRVVTVSAPDGTAVALTIAAVPTSKDHALWLDSTSDTLENGIVRLEDGSVAGIVSGRTPDGLLAVTPTSVLRALALPRVRSLLTQVSCVNRCNIWAAILLDDLLGDIEKVQLVAVADGGVANATDWEPTLAETSWLGPVLAGRSVPDTHPTVLSGTIPSAENSVTVGLRFREWRGRPVAVPIAPLTLSLQEKKFISVNPAAEAKDHVTLERELLQRRSDVDGCRRDARRCEKGCHEDGRPGDCVRLGHHVKVTAPERAVKMWAGACRLLDDEGCAASGEALWNGVGVGEDKDRALQDWSEGCDFAGAQSCLVAAGWLDATGSPESRTFSNRACARGQRLACEHKVLSPSGLRRRWDIISAGGELR